MAAKSEPTFLQHHQTSQAAGIACISVLILSIQWFRQSSTSRNVEKKKRERTAKDSFRVRRSDLLAVSGRGPDRKTRMKRKKWSSNDICCDTNAFAQLSWLETMLVSFKDITCHLMKTICNVFRSEETSLTNTPSSVTTYSSLLPPKISMEGYYDNVKVVGLDCEMVGGGKGGMKSLLARCSVVTLDCTPILKDDSNNSNDEAESPNSINKNLVVLFDKYIIPKGRITDYRTQWSGITKETYDKNTHSVPIVTFHQCQKEITELFSSIEEKSVLVVGHALENDFDALEIKHPATLTRDTAFYRPYMRQVRRRLFPRKLSALTSEELGIEIQQEPNLEEQNETVYCAPKEYVSSLGHSSVEDAAAALRLYWHRCQDWERSLCYPLLSSAVEASASVIRPPIKCFYLDCCNLPLGLRGVDFKVLLGSNGDTPHGNDRVIPSKSVRLVSRQSNRGNTPTIATTDWISYFRATLLPGTYPKISSVVVMLDGAKFRDITQKQNGRRAVNAYLTKRFHLESPKDHGSISLEITEDGDSADDVLFYHCDNESTDADSSVGRMISLNQAADILSTNSSDNDQLDSFIVIRRKAGGSKSHRRLFDKLHLRRPNEGALCLSGLTANLQKDSWRTVCELQRERAVERVIECELRKRDKLTHIVVTDDVLLTERLVQLGTVLVLSYRQMEHMF